MPEAESDYLLEQSTPETLGQEVRSDIILRREKRSLVLRLRRMGLTYEQISDAVRRDAETEFEVTAQGARQIVHRYLEELATQDRESLDQLRELENLRLDHMQKSLAEKIEKASVPAIKTALQIMERRAKLNGLDAPEVKALVGAFAHSHEIADEEVVNDMTQAFVSAFTRRGLPSAPSEAVPTNGRERTEAS